MSIEKCIFCEYAVIHKDYDRLTNAVIACRQHQDIFAPVCQYQFINTNEPTQTNTSNTLDALTPRWIPVSERLPDPYSTVLITIKTKYYVIAPWGYYTDVADYQEDGWETFNDWDEGQEYYITAWMPLPQPWKGEKDE